MQSLRLGWILLIFFLIGVNPVEASEDEVDKGIRSQLDAVQTEKVEAFWDQLKTEYGRFFSDQEIPGIFDLLLSKNHELTMKEVFHALLQYFFHEVLYNGKLLGSIIVLTVLSSIMQTLQTAFERNQVSKVAYSIVFMVIVALAIDSFSVAVETAKSTIGHMVNFMLALVPLLLSLLASLGNFTSVAFFHPLTVFMIHVTGTIIYVVVFPLLFFSAVLSIVSSLSDKYQVNQLANLMRKVSLVIQGGLLTIFLAVISIQGATTAVTDGITIRTAKYLTGNFVPIIGRTISDATDTVVGASLLIKNTIGLAGVVILFLICVFPSLKILCLSFIYNFSAALMQPLGNSPIITSLATIGRTLTYIFASMAAVALMFFLAVTIILVSGNISVMIR